MAVTPCGDTGTQQAHERVCPCHQVAVPGYVAGLAGVPSLSRVGTR